jgi:predicted dehydrogenase
MTLRVAIIGCGAIARVHLPAILGTDGLELVGLFDADAERARLAADRFGVERIFENWPALLAEPTVDIVAILLPHRLHADFAVQALEAGKHVMCEKPLAITLADCDRMIAAAERAERALMPCHTRLFEPATPYLRALLDRGALGDLYLARTMGVEPPATVGVRPWLGAVPDDGVLMAQAVHVAYLLRHLVGEVVEVSCFAGGVRVVDMASEDSAVVLLRFASGAVATMTATFGQRVGPHEHTVTLYGRHGWAEYRIGADRSLEVASRTEFGDDAPHPIDLPDEPNFQTMWPAFAHSVAASEPPPVTGRDGRAAVEIILAAYRSAATGQPVRLPLRDV